MFYVKFKYLLTFRSQLPIAVSHWMKCFCNKQNCFFKFSTSVTTLLTSTFDDYLHLCVCIEYSFRLAIWKIVDEWFALLLNSGNNRKLIWRIPVKYNNLLSETEGRILFSISVHTWVLISRARIIAKMYLPSPGSGRCGYKVDIDFRRKCMFLLQSIGFGLFSYT